MACHFISERVGLLINALHIFFSQIQSNSKSKKPEEVGDYFRNTKESKHESVHRFDKELAIWKFLGMPISVPITIHI
jgi:hypothetical protein